MLSLPKIERRRPQRRHRIPNYLLRKDGKFRRMPAEGLCGVCRKPLTLGPTALVCSNPRCSRSPLVTLDQVPTKVRRMAELRIEWPELIDD